MTRKELKKLIERAYIEVIQEGNKKPIVYSEAEEDPKPEQGPAPLAPAATELPDSTDIILGKFPTLKHALIKLQTEDFKEFTDSIDYISPRPTAFRINLKNGQSFELKWMGKGFEANISGKRYYINSLSDYQQALNKLSVLYREGPMKGAGEVADGFDTAGDAAGGFSGGGSGDFPGGEDFANEPETEPEEGEPGIEGEESKDLGGETIDFEEPSEEPEK